MERPGPEAESLLRPDGRSAVVMQRGGWDGSEGEKAPFLRNEPVKLTPAWEGSNLPNDTLNLKGITMDLAPPKDRWRIIYLTMVLHGLGTLTAWNMFITAKDYFVKYKLKGSPYADNYLVYVGYASQLPNFVFSWFNVFVVLRGDLAKRIVWSLIIEVMIFVVTIVLAMLDTAEWQAAFFWITMALVFLLNACNAVFQNSVFGVAAKLPQQYTGAVILGTNICGTAIVLLDWASSSSGSLRTSAIYYFIGGMFVLLICFDTYFALPLNRFYRYHETLAERTARGNPALPASGAPNKTSVSYLQLLKLTWVQLYNVWVVFFVSLAVFPAVHSDIWSMSNPNRTSDLGEGFLGDNFVRVTCFLTFNLCAMLGNISASLCQFPSRRWLSVFTTLRLAFIPLFLMCNYHPKSMARTMPVLVGSDHVYWALAMLLGWSSGHGSSLAMMYVAGNVPPEYASKAGMVGGAMLITGLMSGIAFSGLGPKIVTAAVWTTT
ncbi:hypothetical protein O0L34_g14543 [Tuta absoluta]|nr:hypothetical protein O0L34_g14543 [Tuta absoluta]